METTIQRCTLRQRISGSQRIAGALHTFGFRLSYTTRQCQIRRHRHIGTQFPLSCVTTRCVINFAVTSQNRGHTEIVSSIQTEKISRCIRAIGLLSLIAQTYVKRTTFVFDVETGCFNCLFLVERKTDGTTDATKVGGRVVQIVIGLEVYPVLAQTPF